MKYQCWWTDSVFQSKVWQFLLTISLLSGALWWQEKPSNIPVKFVIEYVIRCSHLKVAIMLLNSGLQSSPQQRQNKVIHILFTFSWSPKALEGTWLLYSKWSVYSKENCFAAILSLALSCFPLLDVQETQWILLALLCYKTGYFPFLSYERVGLVYLYIEKLQLITLPSCYFMCKTKMHTMCSCSIF